MAKIEIVNLKGWEPCGVLVGHALLGLLASSRPVRALARANLGGEVTFGALSDSLPIRSSGCLGVI